MVYFRKQQNHFSVAWFAAIVGLVAISDLGGGPDARGAGIGSRPPVPSPCAADGICRPNRRDFGHYYTRWRPWPGDPQPKQPTPADDQAADDEMRLKDFERPKPEQEDIRGPAKTKSFEPTEEDPMQALPEEDPFQAPPEEDPFQAPPEEEPFQVLPEEEPFQALPEEEPVQVLPEEELFQTPTEEEPLQTPPEEDLDDLFDLGSSPSLKLQDDAPPELPQSLRKFVSTNRRQQLAKAHAVRSKQLRRVQPKQLSRGRSRPGSLVVQAASERYASKSLANPAAAGIGQGNQHAIYYKATE